MTALLKTLGIRDRSGVEAFIDRLIALLDDLDGDPDIEPDLGWPEPWGRGEVSAFVHTGDDREEDCDREAEPEAAGR